MSRLSWPFILLLGCSVSSVLGCSGDDTSKSSTDAGRLPEKDAGNEAVGPASWTMMGYDSNNNYYQPHETKLSVDHIADLKEHWRVTVPGFPTGSPVIVAGTVYITSTGATLAVELKTGKELWRQEAVAGTSSPAYQDGFLYVHASSGASLYKLDAKDGSIKWGPVKTYPDSQASDGTSSAIVAGDKVLVGHSTFAEVSGDLSRSARGGVEAFSTKDGSPLWTYLTVEGDETGAMVWSSVSVDLKEKVVYATTGNNYTVVGGGSDAFHAIDLETGKRKWKKQVREGDIWTIFGSNAADPLADTDFGANPILAQVDGMPIVAAGDKGAAFWAVRRDTGEILWRRNDLSNTHTPNNGGVLMNGAFDGKRFYVVSNEPPDHCFLHVLNAKDGSAARDPLRLDGLAWGAPSLANGLLFVPVNSVLHVYNASSGEELTSFDTGGTIAAGAAAIADGYVVVKSGLQYMYAADAKNNNEVIAYGLGDAPTRAETQDAGAVDPSTFSAIYKDVIVNSGCSGSALCHGGDGGQLKITDKASAYKALVGVKAMGVNSVPGSGKNCVDSGLTRVVPNKPDESLLMQKLEGKQTCGTEMPPGSKLKDEQLQHVRDWIAAGAKDD